MRLFVSEKKFEKMVSNEWRMRELEDDLWKAQNDISKLKEEVARLKETVKELVKDEG